jgi:hypothetical protein
MTSPFFLFESDFVDSMRCIPMAVRYKLDLSGVKLKLSEWSRLGQAERAVLVTRPCTTAPEAAAYRHFLVGLIERSTGSAPALMPPAEPMWENLLEVPAQVREKSASLNFNITLEGWSSLGSLQRFALIKLSRPGHENRNFLPALREFGLLPG